MKQLNTNPISSPLLKNSYEVNLVTQGAPIAKAVETERLKQGLKTTAGNVTILNHEAMISRTHPENSSLLEGVSARKNCLVVVANQEWLKYANAQKGTSAAMEISSKAALGKLLDITHTLAAIHKVDILVDLKDLKSPHNMPTVSLIITSDKPLDPNFGNDFTNGLYNQFRKAKFQTLAGKEVVLENTYRAPMSFVAAKIPQGYTRIDKVIEDIAYESSHTENSMLYREIQPEISLGEIRIEKTNPVGYSANPELYRLVELIDQNPSQAWAEIKNAESSIKPALLENFRIKYIDPVSKQFNQAYAQKIIAQNITPGDTPTSKMISITRELGNKVGLDAAIGTTSANLLAYEQTTLAFENQIESIGTRNNLNLKFFTFRNDETGLQTVIFSDKPITTAVRLKLEQELAMAHEQSLMALSEKPIAINLEELAPEEQKKRIAEIETTGDRSMKVVGGNVVYTKMKFVQVTNPTLNLDLTGFNRALNHENTGIKTRAQFLLSLFNQLGVETTNNTRVLVEVDPSVLSEKDLNFLKDVGVLEKTTGLASLSRKGPQVLEVANILESNIFEKALVNYNQSVQMQLEAMRSPSNSLPKEYSAQKLTFQELKLKAPEIAGKITEKGLTAAVAIAISLAVGKELIIIAQDDSEMETKLKKIGLTLTVAGGSFKVFDAAFKKGIGILETIAIYAENKALTSPTFLSRTGFFVAQRMAPGTNAVATAIMVAEIPDLMREIGVELSNESSNRDRNLSSGEYGALMPLSTQNRSNFSGAYIDMYVCLGRIANSQGQPYLKIPKELEQVAESMRKLGFTPQRHVTFRDKLEGYISSEAKNLIKVPSLQNEIIGSLSLALHRYTLETYQALANKKSTSEQKILIIQLGLDTDCPQSADGQIVLPTPEKFGELMKKVNFGDSKTVLPQIIIKKLQEEKNKIMAQPKNGVNG
jgi:hypothetical protein